MEVLVNSYPSGVASTSLSSTNLNSFVTSVAAAAAATSPLSSSTSSSSFFIKDILSSRYVRTLIGFRKGILFWVVHKFPLFLYLVSLGFVSLE